MKKSIVIKALFQIFLVVSLVFIVSIYNSGLTYAEENVCCTLTKEGNSCHYIPISSVSQCDGQVVNSRCEQVREWQPVLCDLNEEGVGCSDNLPRSICLEQGGVVLPAGSNAPQCSLGCCIVGNQASLQAKISKHPLCYRSDK